MDVRPCRGELDWFKDSLGNYAQLEKYSEDRMEGQWMRAPTSAEEHVLVIPDSADGDLCSSGIRQHGPGLTELVSTEIIDKCSETSLQL